MPYLVHFETGMVRGWTPLWRGSANFRVVDEAECQELNPEIPVEVLREHYACPEDQVAEVTMSPPAAIVDESPALDDEPAPVDPEDQQVDPEDQQLLDAL
jgi:hypothetical protein